MADNKQAIDRAAEQAKAMNNEAATQANAATDQMAGGVKQAGDAFRDAGQKARDTFSEKVMDPAKRAGDAMKASGQKMAEGGSTIGLRIIDQTQTNASEAFEAMRAAAKANDLSEVMKIQGDYLREQSQRSMTQAREIGELIMQFGREAVAPMRGGEK